MGSHSVFVCRTFARLGGGKEGIQERSEKARKREPGKDRDPGSAWHLGRHICCGASNSLHPRNALLGLERSPVSRGLVGIYRGLPLPSGLRSSSAGMLQTLGGDDSPLTEQLLVSKVESHAMHGQCPSAFRVGTDFTPHFHKAPKVNLPRAASTLPSGLPGHLPQSLLATSSRERKQFALKWEPRNCLKSQAPHKQHLKNRSCYFNYGSGCFITSPVSHTFIRILVINQSLGSRSCQGTAASGLQPSPSQLPALVSPGATGCLVFSPCIQDSDFMSALDLGWEPDGGSGVYSAKEKGPERQLL